MGPVQDGRKRNLPHGELELRDTIPEETYNALAAGLIANAIARKAPPYKETPLSIVKRDADSRILAGLTGKTFWNWLYTDILWVDESLRGQGIGRALMEAAEAEAIRRGCHSAYVWTESFEGPGFYPKLGYEVFAVKPDFPIGYERMGLMKRLKAA